MKHKWDDQQTILVDSGEGAAERLARAGVPLQSVQTILISQLHIEDTGGLYALLGMRFQGLISGELTIYGPRGTQQMVDGLIAALQPLVDLRKGPLARILRSSHPMNVNIIEVTDGSKFMIGPVTVTAASNMPLGSTYAVGDQALSYRFETGERCLIYTGTSGSDSNVECLAHGIDFLRGESTSPTTTLVKEDYSMLFTTLGTQSGPIASAQRSQPSSLLRDETQAVLIDAGDGAASQLARAGVSLQSIETVIISHLHIDHTGDLFALLGRRLQQPFAGELTMYGPRGTKQMVSGLLTALQPLAEFRENPPKVNINVIEITDGSHFMVGSIAVSAATNTHYSVRAGSAPASRSESLSYRFETPARSLVYTGDTGPSANVECLADHADLLVSEIDDPTTTMAQLEKTRHIPFFLKPILRHHFEREHLTAEEVGLLARRSRAKRLVLTHIAIPDARSIESAQRTIASHFPGPITFANDLEDF